MTTLAMSRNLTLSLLAAALCSSFPHALAQDASPSSCFNPHTYGAVAGDGLDDRDAIQHAIDDAAKIHGTVCLDAGDFDISRRPGPGVQNIASLRVAGVTGLTIQGAGAATRLRMLGSGNHADWRLIDITQGSSDVIVRDLWLDGSKRSDTEEQTHLLELTGPVTRVTAERVWFELPQFANMGGGDCVRLLGGANAEVRDVTLSNLTGLSCDRSFISVQRGVHGVRIEDSRSLIVGDQALDFEPTGGLGVSDFEIVHNQFARGPDGQGGYTVAIGGDGSAVADNILFAHNTVLDGGVHVIDAEDVTIQDALVIARGDSTIPPLHARKRTVRLQVLDSTLIRPAGSAVANVVLVHHQSGVAPTDVTLTNCVLEQYANAPLINVESLASLTVSGSSLRYFGAAGPNMAITGRGVIASIAQVTLGNNRIEGSLVGALRLSQYSSSFPTGAVVATGNVARGLSKYGVAFENGAPSVAPIVTGNDFGAVPAVVP